MDIDRAKEVIEIADSDTTNSESNEPNNSKCGVNNNLKPIRFGIDKDTLSHSKAVEYGRKGGVKSGEVRKKRKTAQELLARILATNMTEDQISEILGGADSLLNGDKSAYNVMLVKMCQQAMGGDTKAYIAIRDSVGDKLADTQINLTESITEQDRIQIDKMRKQLMDISKIG